MEKIGKTLTLERVKELASPTFFYGVLHKIREVGEIHELLQDAIDVHIHAYPDTILRSRSMFEVAIEAAQEGLQAVVFKDHYTMTSGEAWLVEKFVEKLFELGVVKRKIKVFGGLVMNYEVGGLNPHAVRAALRYPNTKVIWMPSFSAAHHMQKFGKSGGISVISNNGGLIPEVEQILDMIKEAKGVCISTSHLSPSEILILLDECKKRGIKSLVDHPLQEAYKLTIDEMKECAHRGAYLGIYSMGALPSVYVPVCDPYEMVSVIKEIGAEHCILASDLGQMLLPQPIEGFKQLIRTLIAFGIEDYEIKIMIKENPEKLLSLT